MREDLTGRRYGKLVVLGKHPVEQNTYPKVRWCCVCDCGKEVVKSTQCLKSTLSCGCLQIERTVRANTTHGGTGTATHNAWRSMRNRCLNPAAEHYPGYGGRGITICERWGDYQNFLADMGPRPSNKHSIDRIDNEGNYEPGNCRWATVKQQSRNRRTNRQYTMDGETKCMAEWCEQYGIRLITMYSRLHRGWDIEAAIKTPLILPKKAK